MFKNHRGRGAQENIKNRFEEKSFEEEILEFENDSDGKIIKTQVFPDKTKTLLSKNDSPDVPFEYGLNPYRGCEHGCIYCFARPYHEYLGLSAGLDFETKIFAKFKAPELLRKELSSPKWAPQVIAMSGITDCYQPIERHLKITRGCLEVFAEFLNPVAMITKNSLVTRDIDVLQTLAAHQTVQIYISLTTLDSKLQTKLEPRASSPQARLEAIHALSQAGIPVGVLMAPIIPALNDSEIPKLLEAAAKAGAQFAGHTILRLPYGVKDLFLKWLEDYFPERKQKIIHRLEDMRNGKINDPNFGSRMKGNGIFADEIHKLFSIVSKKVGLNGKSFSLSTASFQKPKGPQLGLF